MRRDPAVLRRESALEADGELLAPQAGERPIRGRHVIEGVGHRRDGSAPATRQRIRKDYLCTLAVQSLMSPLLVAIRTLP